MPLQAGDVALVCNGGQFARAIRFCDAVKARRLHVQPEPFNHAAIMVSPTEVVQASMSSGAVLELLADQTWHEIEWVRWRDVDESTSQMLGALARSLLGTPYNFTDVVALAIDSFGFDPKWVKDREASESTLLCSQLVDLVFQRANLHLFDDGRVPGSVTPGDLARCDQLATFTP